MQQPVSIPSYLPFLQQVAQHILQAHASRLPDLSHCHIFIPNAQAALQLRQALSQQANMAVIGPYIGNMQQWINENIPLADKKRQLVNQHSRQLLLLDALKQHQHLFNKENIWQVCDSLLELFDELTCNSQVIDNPDISHWNTLLRQAYGDETASLAQLNQEAQIVHTLWHAWHQQMHEMNIYDSASAYFQRLHQQTKNIPDDTCFYIIGPEQLSQAEIHWCKAIEKTQTVHYFIQGSGDASTGTTTDTGACDFHHFLYQAYNRQQPLAQRKQVTGIPHEQITGRLSIFSARQLEHEARAIDLQVRLWLLEKKNNIGIVTENRKLARRVRALLERSGISVQDTAGWSLSTTSAATIIERWLECIEEDFAYQPLLDLLKSPFYSDEEDRQRYLADIYRFEQDIILHENIPRDINRYIRAIDNRHNRNNAWSREAYDRIMQLLRHLQLTAVTLRGLYESQRQEAPEIFLEALMQSLHQLDIYQRLENDNAGQRIIQELDKMQLAIKHSAPSMCWQDFRTWLGRTLESEQFKPQSAPSRVKLMNLKQAQYCQFDALVIAAANRGNLPGTAKQTAFFNQAVRYSLGISNWSIEKDYSFLCFRNLLESAENTLISYQQEENGEWLQASPWVSALVDFALLSSGIELENHSLHQLCNTVNCITNCDIDTLPTLTTLPAPALDKELITTTFSASKHQRLIDCPYKFFASDGLQLKPAEQIVDELSKSDYGNKVHTILHAFHRPHPGLPAPFPQTLSNENKHLALQHMEKLSQMVFSQDLEDTVQHRSWLKRWMKTAHAYIDWQIERQQSWQIDRLEENFKIEINPFCTLEGRLDRIDSAHGEFAIIDYKTGTPPKQKDIKTGEDVQLISYAQLLENVSRVEYLKLDKGTSKTEASLDKEQLDHIKQLNRQRMIDMVSDIHQQKPLPAWGDENSCQYCDLSGLCRKQIFAANNTSG